MDDVVPAPATDVDKAGLQPDRSLTSRQLWCGGQSAGADGCSTYLLSSLAQQKEGCTVFFHAHCSLHTVSHLRMAKL